MSDLTNQSSGGIQGTTQGDAGQANHSMNREQQVDAMIIDEGINRMVDDGGGVVNQTAPYGEPILRQQPKDE